MLTAMYAVGNILTNEGKDPWEVSLGGENYQQAER